MRLLVNFLSPLCFPRASNVHVVYYSQIEHAEPRDPLWRHERSAYVHPLYFVRNMLYADMKKYADVVVKTKQIPNEMKLPSNIISLLCAEFALCRHEEICGRRGEDYKQGVGRGLGS